MLSCSNTFGKLCKVNIYKLKSLVLTVKSRRVLWLDNTEYLVLISATLVFFYFEDDINNKTYKFKHIHT